MNQERSITSETTIVYSKDVVTRELGDEVVMLNLSDGVYYGLEGIGSRIWDLIQLPRTIGEIRDTLVEKYDVAADACERDLIALLTDLAAHGLVKVAGD